MSRLTERERLVELINQKGDAFDERFGIECSRLADYLLENGVVVLPCKVGDTVYRACRRVDSCKNGHVRKIEITPRNVQYVTYCLQKGEYFLTREEAEAALKGESEDE